MLRSKLMWLHWFLSSQLGMDPMRTLRSLRGIPRYLADLRKFRVGHKGSLNLSPCLYDWYEEGGATRTEYFWQDLLVAQKIFRHAPKRHVDIGSRIDGFVAHVASFREIEVYDVRPITAVIPNIHFRQADLMRGLEIEDPCCDSLSCLHALEHFGLGRYGDPVDPYGWRSGLANMSRLLHSGGHFYLSVPVGRERVEFNANRVFDAATLVAEAVHLNLRLLSLEIVEEGHKITCVDVDSGSLQSLAHMEYALAMLTFVKG
jgi:hypothetical protein